ncbi:glycosyltransferase family 4 protein [Methylobacter sp.]|uniref:glycosyltransferase family 4 protein n=1 Tax=Methylobacter sp. TaxID=2051955 RepID=UPI0011F65571|nr:glycosyltransferase family 4 protein [Methylobacter sp.]TAK61987.1 MAG: glycosyltransferase [Methylobacter sp.]
MNHLSPLNLLQLVPEPLPTFRADVSVLFGKYLPRHGVQCHIVGMPGGDMNNQDFASVRRSYPAKGRWSRELSYLLLCLRALLGTRQKSCDLIQVRDMVSIGLLAMLIARLKGIPFVFWISYLMTEGRIERSRASIDAGAGFRSRLVLLKGLVEKALLYRLVLPGARHVFVQSEAMKELIAARGIPLNKLTAVPMGVDTETLQFGSVRKQRLPGWEEVPLIAYLGTLDRMRRLHEVIDALAIVKARHPQARLLFIGNSLDRSDTVNLLEHAKRLGLDDSVHVTGWLPTSQAWALLAGADATVSFFPRGEILDTNSPTKLLEYLALGLPCVGNDNPDQAQVLSASGAGWLTDSTIEALAQALCEILDDPEAARKRAASGPAYINAVRSYEVLASKVAEQYRLIAAASCAPVPDSKATNHFMGEGAYDSTNEKS